jgi:membrane AbrB-like protein
LNLRLGMQVFAGAFIGIGLDREGLARMGDLGIPLLILVVGIFIFVLLVTLLLHKVAGLDFITSMLSSTPGGVQEMSLLSEDIGGDTPKIAVMQTARLISVILFFPLMLQFILRIIE